MAGAGSRFATAGYVKPKPFIEIHGKMMIERVLEGVLCERASYIIIIQKNFLNSYEAEINYLVNKYKLSLVEVDKTTEGASCTVLAAHKLINSYIPLLICDCDNIIENEVFQNFIRTSLSRKDDGVLMTYFSNQNYFSFAKVDKNNYVCDIREKEVISSNAIAGFYFIAQGEDFINSTIDIIIYNQRSKNEFYISDVYKNLISKNKRISLFEVNEKQIKCVGTPEQLHNF